MDSLRFKSAPFFRRIKAWLRIIKIRIERRTSDQPNRNRYLITVMIRVLRLKKLASWKDYSGREQGHPAASPAPSSPKAGSACREKDSRHPAKGGQSPTGSGNRPHCSVSRHHIY